MNGPGAEPPTQFSIRRMNLTDVNAVIEIARSLREAPQWPAASYLAALNDESTPRRIALVAEGFAEDRRASARPAVVAGFAVVRLVEQEAELETIAVAAEWQRRGVGGHLLAVVTEEARHSQVREIALEVRASNKTALRFYGALGWVETGRRPRYYADPVEDAVLMALRFG